MFNQSMKLGRGVIALRNTEYRCLCGEENIKFDRKVTFSFKEPGVHP
jgi:hypothetical protein